MPVTPEHDISLELLHLENTLAASQMFRAVVEEPDADWDTVKALADAETADETAARARIIWEELDASVSDAPPQAIIRQLPDTLIERDAWNGFEVRGSLLLLLEFPVPTDYRGTAKDAATDFGNKIGRIIREMKQAAIDTPANLLNIIQIQRGAIARYDEDHLPDLNGPAPDVPFYSIALIVHHQGGY